MRKLRLSLVILTSLILFGVTFIGFKGKAYALSGSDFNAGRIIDDSLFYSGGTMTSSEIQAFLNAKMPICDTNGTQMRGNETRANYGISRGYSPPYTCLKDYTENTSSKAADSYCAGNYNGGTKTAAQIIDEVSRACSVSPKALIVLLQKEQSLVTDDWPWSIQYRSATGYGCPDTAACDSQYYGFFNQVYNAARQFQRYAKQPTLFNYRSGRTSYIQYNPNASCGGSNVYIENAATAALYNYTPYQPNASSLSNLYGSGDSCGAYGNRNFWRLWNDWFGTTSGPPFYAQYVSQSPYPVLDSSTGGSIFFNFRNAGTAFWKDDLSNFPGYVPVHLATSWPVNRSSAFRASNWLSPSRPTGFFSRVYESDGTTLASDQHTVQPGQIARFEFTINADASIPGGVYREYFQPVAEGAPGYTWNMGGWAYMDIGVNKPDYRAAYISQSPYPTINKGGSSPAWIRFKNVGVSPWLDDVSVHVGKRPIHLSTSWPINRASSFGSTWASVSRPNLNFSKVYEADGTTLASAQHTVQPGQIVQFEFTLSVPANTPSGTYREYFEPIVEGAPGNSWSMGITTWLGITVP